MTRVCLSKHSFLPKSREQRLQTYLEFEGVEDIAALEGKVEEAMCEEVRTECIRDEPSLALYTPEITLPKALPSALS